MRVRLDQNAILRPLKYPYTWTNIDHGWRSAITAGQRPPTREPWTGTARRNGRTVVSMLRLLMLIGAVIVVAFVVIAIMHLLFYLAMVAIVVVLAGLAFGVFRAGRWSGKRSESRR
jgi:hypothetical protein